VSIRVRLTLLYALLLAVVLVGFSAIFYWVLLTSLNADVDSTLNHFTQETHRALGHSSAESWLQHTTVISLETISVNEFSSPGVYIQVLDERGRAVAASSNLRDGQLPIDPGVIQDGLAGRSVYATLAAGQDERVRVLTTPILVQGQVVGLVQVGQSLHTVDSTASEVRLLLATGILLSLAIAILMGWLLADRALRPVAQIAQTAQRIVTAQDLSQRIAFRGVRDEIGLLADTFNAMLARLDRAFQSQQQFVSDSSHELRTPLTVILGNLDLLKRGGDPAGQSESMSAIRSEAVRMRAIVNDLLLLAQLDAPRPEKHPLVDLDSLVVEVCKTLQPLAADRTLVLGEVQPVQIRGDADDLKRMILNLVENALKYSSEGVRVVVQCTLQGHGDREPGTVVRSDAPQSSPGNPAPVYATVSVADSGPGIAPEHLPHLFDRFYRVDKARSRQIGGTGLGLAIVKGTAEAHGGWVSVDSQVGKGTTFTVWLPLSRE
jgi:two-component system, OmpR family, sensor kinase